MPSTPCISRRSTPATRVMAGSASRSRHRYRRQVHREGRPRHGRAQPDELSSHRRDPRAARRQPFRRGVHARLSSDAAHARTAGLRNQLFRRPARHFLRGLRPAGRPAHRASRRVRPSVLGRSTRTGRRQGGRHAAAGPLRRRDAAYEQARIHGRRGEARHPGRPVHRSGATGRPRPAAAGASVGWSRWRCALCTAVAPNPPSPQRASTWPWWAAPP